MLPLVFACEQEVRVFGEVAVEAVGGEVVVVTARANKRKGC